MVEGLVPALGARREAITLSNALLQPSQQAVGWSPAPERP